MSMVICEDCDLPIDSDTDPDCFVEAGNMRRLHAEIILCENCRERRWERDQERLMEDDPAQTVVSIVRQAFPSAPVSTDEHGTVIIDLSRLCM